MSLNSFLLVFLGGGIGASLRFLIEILMRDQFLGILISNLLGCFLIGFLTHAIGANEQLRLLFIVGLLGGFTTFSSYILFMSLQGLNVQAILFLSLHNILGMLLFYLGYKISTALIL